MDQSARPSLRHAVARKLWRDTRSGVRWPAGPSGSAWPAIAMAAVACEKRRVRQSAGRPVGCTKGPWVRASLPATMQCQRPSLELRPSLTRLLCAENKRADHPLGAARGAGCAGCAEHDIHHRFHGQKARYPASQFRHAVQSLIRPGGQHDLQPPIGSPDGSPDGFSNGAPTIRAA